MSDPNNYTIGWISAIEIEYTAAQEFLDEEHKGPKWVHQSDENHYALGRIGKHNVVIVVLPRGDNGVAAAAMAAKDMMHSFPNVRVCLMVGIGGGAPSKRHDIRLGDVVVSVPTFSEKGGNQGGVVQYDYGRTIQEKCFQGARYLNRPPRALLTAVTGLSAKYKRYGNDIDTTIDYILQRNRRLQREYGRPDPDSDKLYSRDSARTLGADENLVSSLIERPERSGREDNPAIHYGLIASADGFMEDAQIRDVLAEELDVLCFEMEAAGLMNSFPCLVIRGICDYSDRHWFKEWRGYAAMTAAAYAKGLLEMVPASDVDKMQTIKEADLVPPDFMERARSFIAPLWGDRKKEVVSVSVIPDPEETQTMDSTKDQPYQMPPIQIAKLPPATTGFISSQIEVKHVYIAVMGVTGAGKSSLISRCTGKNVKIGHKLVSCTADVEDVEFMLNDRVCVHLIDTPGFDDTNRSDVEVLQNIAVWLTDSWRDEKKLSGIIYLHRIIDVRMAGSTLRNLSMFKKLCGEGAYSSVVLATTMWSQVDEATGEQREQELIETPNFWGYMHDKGSRIFRLEQTRESCLEIIQYILSRDSTTLLELQDEIVNQHRQIEDTEAGVQLNEDIIRERLKHQAELYDLKTHMQEMAVHDAELQRALKEEYEKLKENIRRNDEEQAKLKQDLKDVYERKEREFLELKKQMEADRKKYEESQKEALRQQAEQQADRIRLLEENSRKQLEFLELKKQMEADRKKYEETQKEALKRQAEQQANRIRLIEEHSRKQLEFLEQKASEQEERIRLTEENNNKQKEAIERQVKENANRAKAWAENRDTALHLAALDGKADVTESLLIQGANIEAKNNEGRTPFYVAICNGNTDMAISLLNQGANIEATQEDGSTALHIVVFHGKTDMVKFLLQHGANVNAKTYDYQTPFGIAIWDGKLNIAKLLLSQGANIEATQNDGCTMLHVMAAYGRADMVKFLLNLGANIEAKTNVGSTPFGLAIRNGKAAVGKLLLNRGADIEAQQTNDGGTELHIVAATGKGDMVKFLLDHGANIEAKNNHGSTPFCLAIWNGKMMMANLLLNRGANIEARQNARGFTELHIMACYGKVDIVKFLLDHGANIEAKTNDGRTPLRWAVLNGKADVVKLLRARGARG
ncbi:hypothetical protein THAR02_04384 [Trichoderma harzianum]|uniref:Uncharacterized protein n=1 Tax=Trichoderma harzianum TaxID=5544 RepID=A0A0F9XEV2_TRIHA|nr:hypothetical protein THAR02_04384 [Trichoderma harzianum]